jgi:hypothetical protein
MRLQIIYHVDFKYILFAIKRKKSKINYYFYFLVEYFMKKTYTKLAVWSTILVWVLLTHTIVVNAQSDKELEDLLQEINQEIGSNEQKSGEEQWTAHNAANPVTTNPWTYDDIKNEFLRDEVTATWAHFRTTTAKFQWTPVKEYRIYYATWTIQTANPEDIMDKVVAVDKREWKYSFFKLDGLMADTQYYAVVTPVNPNNASDDWLDRLSEEITFKTAIPAANSWTQVFANVSYTYKDNKVTLTWTPSWAAKAVDLHIRHQGETVYQKVGTVDMAKWEYSFTVTKEWNYFVKLQGKNDKGELVGQEHAHTVKIDTIVAPENVVENPPKVGAATDALIGMILFGALLYFVYRFRRTS